MANESQINDEQLIEKKVSSAISAHLKIYKVAAWSFITGLLLFMSLGFITKGEMFRSMMKVVYPPEDIYKDIVKEFLKDEEFKHSLVNKTDYSKIEIKNADFNTFPLLKEKLPDKVWDTISKGDAQNYSEFVSKREFFEALKEYHSEITKSFLTPSNNRAEILAKLDKVMDVKIDVIILMAGENAESAKTAKCYNWFKNQEYHVELVVPNSYPDSELSWLRCDLSWPDLYLTLESDDAVLPRPVKLVGARRNGNAKRPILLISQKIAEDLKLDDWDNYRSKANGVIALHSAK